jgi:glycosyltransferase involved in cell wall biosynthesis
MKVVITAMEVGKTNGGKGRYTLCIMRGLVPQLKSHGCEVTILAAQDAPLSFFESCARIVRLPVPKNTGLWRAVWEEVYFPIYAWGADVFLSMNGLLPLGPVRSKRNVVVFYDIHPLQHQADPKQYPGQYSRKSLRRTCYAMKKAARDADQIVTISDSTTQELQTFLGVPRNRMVMIPCGVEHNVFYPQDSARVEKLRKRYGLPEEFYLFIGIPNAEAGDKKNLHLIVETYAQARQPEKYFLPVVIAGGERAGQRSEPVEVALGGPAARGRFLYLGFVPDEDFAALYAAARALIFPSFHEGFGIPPLEAMACGTPVIAANRPAIPEVVGDAALLIDPASPESLREALRQVNEAGVRQELIAKGFERARLFSWERGAEVMLRIILGTEPDAFLSTKAGARP